MWSRHVGAPFPRPPRGSGRRGAGASFVLPPLYSSPPPTGRGSLRHSPAGSSLTRWERSAKAVAAALCCCLLPREVGRTAPSAAISAAL